MAKQANKDYGACATSTPIDCVRERAAAEHTRPYARTLAAPGQAVPAHLERDALWQALLALAATPAERIALVESFAYSLPPHAIQARHPQLFADIAAVYNAKRNLLDRIGRSSELGRLQDAFVSMESRRLDGTIADATQTSEV